jgi:hypothetical protein
VLQIIYFLSFFAENADGEIPTQSYSRNIPQQELSKCNTESLPTFYVVKTPTQLPQGQTDGVGNRNASPLQHPVFSWAPTSHLLPRHAVVRGTTKKKALPTIEQELVPTTEHELVPTTEQELVPTTEQELVPTTEHELVPITEHELVPTTEQELVPTTEQELIPTTTLEPLPITAGTMVPTAERKLMHSDEGKPGPIPENEFFRELMPTSAQQFDDKNR